VEVLKKKGRDSRSRDSQDKALSLCFKLLSYRMRSEEEIRERLTRKGFSKEVIDGVVQELKEKGLINDREAAESFLRVAKESRLLGKKGIKEFLYKRGISKDIIMELLEKFDEREGAEEILRKRILKKIGGEIEGSLSRNQEESIRAYLLRKGYEPETINEVFKKFREGKI
jgi:regulatory protein